MQFIENGPHIPNYLLDELERGNVIFFCGAGISMGNGLPNFEQLVDYLYNDLGRTLKQFPIEEKLYNDKKYDLLLNELEKQVSRDKVRQELFKILSTNQKSDLHSDILKLSYVDYGSRVRLVTTNYDRSFHIDNAHRYYAAPLIPIINKVKWNGIVYLHGLLPEQPNVEDLNELILTSADFGKAYLSERWASRFVTDLLKEFTVCFIGYSVEDPVMRYLIDAISLDKANSKVSNKVFAFTDYNTNEYTVINQWKSKGIEPILYKADETIGHVLLNSTIKEWAKIYSNGVEGKNLVIQQNANIVPTKSNDKNDFIGRVVWALTDPKAKTAETFAKLKEPPHYKWLSVLESYEIPLDEYEKYGINLSDERKNELARYKRHTPINTPINRIESYPYVPKTSLFEHITKSTSIDPLIYNIGIWLCHYLGNPDLLVWVSKKDAKLHHQIKKIFEEAINNRQGLQLDDFHLKLWGYMLSSYAYDHDHLWKMFKWKESTNLFGLTTPLLYDLKMALSPRISIDRKHSLYSTFRNQNGERTKSSKDEFDIRVRLNSDHVDTVFDEMNKWNEANLIDLIGVFENCLVETLKIFEDLALYNTLTDPSPLFLASLIPDKRNFRTEEWLVLIELLRDYWLKLAPKNSSEASIITERWAKTKFVSFKRLAFYTASSEYYESHNWVDWLIQNDAELLWNTDVQVEVMGLLKKKSIDLSNDDYLRLENAVRTNSSYLPKKSDDFISSPERLKWMRYENIILSGRKLTIEAKADYESIINEEPLKSFLERKSKSEDYSRIPSIKIDRESKHKTKEVVEWLELVEQNDRYDKEEIWSSFVFKHPLRAFDALCNLYEKKKFLSHEWNAALYAIGSNNQRKYVWKYFYRLFERLTEANLREIDHSLSYYLSKVSGLLETGNKVFISISKNVLSIDVNSQIQGSQVDDITDALNHPHGKITEGLCAMLFNKGNLTHNEVLDPFKSIFSTLLVNKDRNKQAIIILGSKLNAFYQLDKVWTIKYLIPLFDINLSKHKKLTLGLWSAFFLYNYYDNELFNLLKKPFLALSSDINKLSVSKNNYLRLLLSFAIEPPTGYSNDEIKESINILKIEDLALMLNLLSDWISTSENSAQYWRKKIKPLFENKIIPVSNNSKYHGISEAMALIAISSGEYFSEALETLDFWLIPINNDYRVLKAMDETKIHISYPNECLILLSKVIVADHIQFPTEYLLKPILQKIVKIDPLLKDIPEWKRLWSFANN